MNETLEIRNVPDPLIVTAALNPWLSLVQDGADIAEEKIPPIVQIIEGIVGEHSKLVIGSGSKSFKTWVTIAMALCIAHGLPWLGRMTARRRVLYVNLELKRQTFNRRVQTVAKALGITIEREWFTHLPLRGQMTGAPPFVLVQRIIEIARQSHRAVVVLDPIYKANTEGDENSSRDQTVFFNQLDRITTGGECTLILNDHFGKGNQSEKDPLDAIRGSSAKGGDVDAALILRRHEVDGSFRVDVVHRELPPVEPFCIGWNYPLMELRPDLSPEAMKKNKGGRSKSHDPFDLISAIRDTTEANPISITKWAEKIGVSRQTLQGYVPALHKKGWIKTVGEGNCARRCITEKGRDLVSLKQTD
jgi:predicted transcriptional regulator